MAEARESNDNSSSLAAGSEVTFDIVCTPCDNAGDTNEADTYCLQCAEYLCVTCKKYHSRLAGAKHHTLVDKDNVPGTQGSLPVNDVCTQLCQTHPDEMIKYYCPIHRALGCGDCMIRSHDKCEGKLYIPDEAKNIDSSKEFNDFQSLIEKLTETSESMIKSSHAGIIFTADCRAKTLQDIETFRQEMNDALDELKSVLDEQTKEVATQVEISLSSVTDQANQVLKEIQRISSDFDTLKSKKQHCQMYIEMKSKEDKVRELQKQLDVIGTSSPTAFRFKPDDDLQKLLKRRDALGELLEKNMDETTATHVADINVKSGDNIDTCWISGATLMSKDKLVIADWNNKTIKLIDTEQRKIVSEYTPETAANSVDRVSYNRVVGTLPDAKKIVFLRTDDTLTLANEICFDQECWRIAYTDEKLVVSFNTPSEIRVLNLTGETLQTFSTSSTGERLFSSVPRVTVSTFTQAIYATDWGENRVSILDMEGNVVTQYKDDDLKNPAHSAVDDMGMVYVCGCSSNNIHLLTPYCSKVKILLTKGEGIKWPQSVCYCKDTRRLYVGMKKNDIVKVFQLS